MLRILNLKPTFTNSLVEDLAVANSNSLIEVVALMPDQE